MTDTGLTGSAGFYNGFSGSYTYYHQVARSRPKFCSECGIRLGDTWQYCTGCGDLISVPPPASAGSWDNYQPYKPPCLFDGLPPGSYGLVCSCPKCAPGCCTTQVF